MNNKNRRELEFRITASWDGPDGDGGIYAANVFWNAEPTELIQLFMSAMKASPEMKACITAAVLGFDHVDKTFGGL